MRIRLTPELQAYCAEHKISVTDGMELDDSKLADARAMWSRQHPHKDAEEIEIHAIGLVAAQVRPAPKAGELFLVPPAAQKRDWKDVAWKIAVLILLLLIAIRGHAQIDVIKVQDSAGAPVGTIAAPFTFKAGANCAWAKSASTYTFNCSGGAAGAGGSNTQVQYNSTGSLGGISSLTTDGTVVTALTGADWLFADLTTPTKKFQFDASNISAVTTRTMNVPDANATFAQAISAVSHKFITQMSAQGVFTLAQPACGDISDAGAFCSGTAYSSLTGAPTLPANTTATASNFFTAYNSTTGAFTKAQPAFSDLSGSISVGQSQSLSGDVTGAVNATVVGKVNGIVYSATAAAHSVEVITTANTTATAKVIPDCTDTGGNHLNFTQSTDAFSCGTSGGTGSANPTNLSVQGQTSASTTSTGANCTSGLLLYTKTITGATLAVNDRIDIVAVAGHATGTTDAPRYCIALGASAGTGNPCTSAINSSGTDNAYKMECHVTVTGSSAQWYDSYVYRLTNGALSVEAMSSGTLALAVASNIVVEVFAYNVNSTDTFRGFYFSVTQNVNK